MGVIACSCEVGLGNTGTPNCEEIAKVGKKLIFVPTYKADGTRNGLDLTSAIDNAVITALINAADQEERWYPAPNLENVEDVRADPITESANSGTSYFIQEGQRTFVGLMFDQGSVLLGKLQAMVCQQMSAYVVDKGASLIGVVDPSAPTIFRPIDIQDSTFYPRLVKATDTAIQKIQLNFTWSDLENDANLRMILATEVPDVSFLNLRGLLDVDAEYSNESTTTFTAALSLQYGTALAKNPVKGLVIGDFSLYNETTPGAVAITSVTESAPGVYDFVFPAQTASDVLTLTPTKNGYDFTNVVESPITL